MDFAAIFEQKLPTIQGLPEFEKVPWRRFWTLWRRLRGHSLEARPVLLGSPWREIKATDALDSILLSRKPTQSYPHTQPRKPPQGESPGQPGLPKPAKYHCPERNFKEVVDKVGQKKFFEPWKLIFHPLEDLLNLMGLNGQPKPKFEKNVQKKRLSEAQQNRAQQRMKKFNEKKSKEKK